MPKKFAGENSKAVAARARKSAAKDTEKAKKQQEEEDAYWKDNDKNLVKKQQRKEEQERKKQEQLEKKQAIKQMLEQEMEGIKKPTKVAPPPKITRAQIESSKTAVEAKKEKEVKKVETHIDRPIEENINRLTIEGEEARNVDEAISILTGSTEDMDKHPEKRMKAAYLAFEEKRLAELKEESPSLKLSQLKQMIFKEWQKSPSNPLNASKK